MNDDDRYVSKRHIEWESATNDSIPYNCFKDSLFNLYFSDDKSYTTNSANSNIYLISIFHKVMAYFLEVMDKYHRNSIHNLVVFSQFTPF